MRLDKYLKVSRLIKRRTVAKEEIEAGKVLLNTKIAKASNEVNIGDQITLLKTNKSYEVVLILQSATEEKATSMYREL